MSDSPTSMASGLTVRVVYLARLREAFGCASEQVTLPMAASTVATLVATLRSRRGVWEAELESGRAWRVAVNHALSADDARLAEGDEVAFLPPVTGG